LEYLHNSGVIHRDLKPENVLLDANMHLKLTDFGTAKVIGTEKNARSNSFVGTAEYVSPELLNDKVTYKSSDLWALGCIIYQMITGRTPFRGMSEFLIFQKVGQADFQYPKGFPEIAKDLINQLLVLDPEKRIGCREAGYHEIKSHPFFKEIDFDNLHKLTPPPIKPYPSNLIFEEDVLAEEEAKRKKMQEEESEKWYKI
jgi:3-phosphoinositide dependent protein kinase-1